MLDLIDAAKNYDQGRRTVPANEVEATIGPWWQPTHLRALLDSAYL